MPVQRTPSARLVLDPTSEELLEGLAGKLGLTRSGVMRLALRRLAEMENYPIPTPPTRQGKAAA